MSSYFAILSILLSVVSDVHGGNEMDHGASGGFGTSSVEESRGICADSDARMCGADWTHYVAGILTASLDSCFNMSFMLKKKINE